MSDTTRKGYTAEELEHIASQAHALDWYADLARQAAAQARVLEKLKAELAQQSTHRDVVVRDLTDVVTIAIEKRLSKLMAEEGLS